MSQDMAAKRRSVLKTLGTVGGGAAVGGAGIWAFTGSAAAESETTIEPAAVQELSSDDGSLRFVAVGGKLRFDWDGLDTNPTHGAYASRVRLAASRFDGGSTGWVNLGEQSGELGGSWGGDNDYTQDAEKEGHFTFRFGHEFGQRDYALTYTDDVTEDDGPTGLHLIDDPSQDGSQPPIDPSLFTATEDGGSTYTILQIEYTCRVYDGDPTNGGTVLVEDGDVGEVPVDLKNEEATGDTSGQLDGSSDA